MRNTSFAPESRWTSATAESFPASDGTSLGLRSTAWSSVTSYTAVYQR
ncbi:hypothetical protein [Streptomyces alboflavus]|nr:hypothetical protein [Streptomyces alboflavus]